MQGNATTLAVKCTLSNYTFKAPNITQENWTISEVSKTNKVVKKQKERRVCSNSTLPIELDMHQNRPISKPSQ